MYFYFLSQVWLEYHQNFLYWSNFIFLLCFPFFFRKQYLFLVMHIRSWMCFFNWTSENGPQETNQSSSWCQFQRVLGWTQVFPQVPLVFSRVWGLGENVPIWGKVQNLWKISVFPKLWKTVHFTCFRAVTSLMHFDIYWVLALFHGFHLQVCIYLWFVCVCGVFRAKSLPHLLRSVAVLCTAACLPFSRSLLSHQACVLNIAALC